MLSAAGVCLALTMYFEAQGEGPVGMMAVGQVVLNRTHDKRFPSTVCEVVKQRGPKSLRKCQFAWYCDGLEDKPTNKGAWLMSTELAGAMLDGSVSFPLLSGATCYHATWATKPAWASNLKPITQVREHAFYAC